MSIQFPRRALALALASVVAGAATLSTPAHAVSLANDTRLGDAALFQYYTAKAGWQTFFRIINTSNDAIVVKVRFREAANSREVLNFEVALSPNDMWAGWTDANVLPGQPGIKTNDTSCVFPLPGQSNPNGEGFITLDPTTNLIGALFKDRAFTGVYDDNGPDAALRLSEGHIEVIGVARYRSAGGTGGTNNAEARFVDNVRHNAATGKPNDCANAQAAYLDLASPSNAGVDVPNVLAANAYMVNIGSGQGAGYDPDILAGCRSILQPSLRNEAVASDTNPDLDSCDPGLFTDVAGAAVNQALWNGLTPIPVTTFIRQADVNNDGVIGGLYNFDTNNDGTCDLVDQPEDNVPQSVYDAAQKGLIDPSVPGAECYQIVDSTPINPPPVRLTATETVQAVEPWRLKQKGDIVDRTDPLNPTNAYPVVGGVDWVSSLFMAQSVINEWAASNNPGNIITDYYTQWVLTFPTKDYYVDLQDDANLLDDISPTLAAFPLPVNPPEAFSPFWQAFATGAGLATGNEPGQSCEPITVDMWNREERFSQFTSPAPAPENSLCWETNVLTFNDRYADSGLDSDFTTVIDQTWLPTNFDGTVAERGWARVTFDGFAAVNTGLVTGFGGVQYGLPVTGFLFSVYETGNAATNHAAINAHKYER